MTDDRWQQAVMLSVISYLLYGKFVSASCFIVFYDFYGFYDFYDFYDFNGFSTFDDLTCSQIDQCAEGKRLNSCV